MKADAKRLNQHTKAMHIHSINVSIDVLIEFGCTDELRRISQHIKNSTEKKVSHEHH